MQGGVLVSDHPVPVSPPGLESFRDVGCFLRNLNQMLAVYVQHENNSVQGVT